MDNLLNSDQANLFFKMLANPEQVGSRDTGLLESLVKAYPQVGVLRALLARAYKDISHDQFEEKLRSASVYAADRALLYRVVNHPERLHTAEVAQLLTGAPVDMETGETAATLIEEEGPTYNEVTPAPLLIGEPAAEEFIDEDEQVYDEVAPHFLVEEPNGEELVDEQGAVEDITLEEPVEEALSAEEASDNPQDKVELELLIDEDEEEVSTKELADEDELVGEDELVDEDEVDEFERAATSSLEETGLGDGPPEEEDLNPVDIDEEDAPLVVDEEQPSVAEAGDELPGTVEDTESAEHQIFDEEQYLAVLEEQFPRSVYEDVELPATVTETSTTFDEDEYNSAVEEETAFGSATEVSTEPEAEIDDEIFDEITGIDEIQFEPASFKLIVEDGVIPRSFDEIGYEEEDDTGLVLHESVVDPKEETETPEIEPPLPAKAPLSEEERLIIGNIAASNYFAFDERFPAPDANKVEAETPSVSSLPVPVAAQHNAQNIKEDDRVSKYHDDKMPFSFMWWLDKTRREHANTYQPYIPYKQVNPKMMQLETPTELQRQYYENIFNLTTAEALSKQKAEFDDKKKGDAIIERFIKEEPQIGPPSNEKLDNENKAKKSAEDQGELVSETLARIYMDQMMYHKAINTYKKLLLKFPEKSSYFVTQIELLERKIN